MKVLMINGSPKANACIGTALKITSEVLKEQGIESETVHIGNKDIRGCIACLSCGRCTDDPESGSEYGIYDQSHSGK